jgi:alanyl-tRNA synthetase
MKYPKNIAGMRSLNTLEKRPGNGSNCPVRRKVRTSVELSLWRFYRTLWRIHVDSTASIGLFRITAETSIAAGIRRIEAVTGKAAEDYINERIDLLDTILSKLNNPKNPLAAIDQILEENTRLRKIAESFQAERAARLQKDLLASAFRVGEIRIVTEKVQSDTPALLKDIAFPLGNTSEKTIMLLGTELDTAKAHLALMISQ